MNTTDPIPEENEFFGVEQALRRAALRAREIAAQTGTPLVVYRDGKIQHLWVTPKNPATDESSRQAANITE